MIIVLPHQLFEPRLYLALAEKIGASEIIIFEDPCFFGDRREQPGAGILKLNKLRLAYQRLAIDRFRELLIFEAKPFDIKVRNISVDEIWDSSNESRYAEFSRKKVDLFDPCDSVFSDNLNKFAIPTIHDSPMWLLNKSEVSDFLDISNFHKKPKPLMRMSPLYNFIKEKLGILKNQKSLDTLNRDAFPADSAPPPPPYIGGLRDSALIGKAAEWVCDSKHFKDNPGGGKEREIIEMLAKLPCDHKGAQEWLKKFLVQRFENFGPFEDAIVPGEPWMFHSGLSIYMNFGLVTPLEVVNAVKAHYEALNAAHKKKLLPCYEGFIRQMLGWRELCRVYYVAIPLDVCRRNVFKLKGKLESEWYDSETAQAKLPPVVADAVKDAWAIGYLHHIRRLMVCSNYMMLSEISPDECFKWMFEFALDGWDWAMRMNVYAMGSWSDGGVSLRKPYISSSNYIDKMQPKGLQKTNKSWQESWNKKFRDFIDSHEDVLRKTELARLIKK